ncbi:conserved hypothetical protein [Ricinus communis]|uniref:Uncharacterized protein n=1 Tax=Ricinus communis TaxID=3988 RepID=B9SJY7_RICCO|nr:conserved hypothetical protein [Ricinus communis]
MRVELGFVEAESEIGRRPNKGEGGLSCRLGFAVSVNSWLGWSGWDPYEPTNNKVEKTLV